MKFLVSSSLRRSKRISVMKNGLSQRQRFNYYYFFLCLHIRFPISRESWRFSSSMVSWSGLWSFLHLRIHTIISQYWYELACCYRILSALYSGASHACGHSMSRDEIFFDRHIAEICTLWIWCIHDLWADFYECDEVMELEYGGDRYDLGNAPYSDYWKRHVFCYS